MAERILLIEDDHELGAQIVGHLERAGYEAIWWKQGKHVSADDPPSIALVVLDLMLPGVYGMDILKSLRTNTEIPVLVLSARKDTSDKVRALKLGADDYMTKPFWPEELIERVRARLRRPTLQRADAIKVGALRIDFTLREVRVEEKIIDVTPVEFQFLSALARRPGAAVTRRWLAENILETEREGAERTLDVHVSRLRKKLGGGFIKTVWGIGYRLTAEQEP